MAFLNNNKPARITPESKTQTQYCPHCHKDINAPPSKVATREKQDDIMDALGELEGIIDALTTWEQEFIGSIRTQVTSGRKLSDKQAEIIWKTYEKRIK